MHDPAAVKIITAQVLLLDMGGTFMFECDRFSNVEDLHSSYGGFGGRVLTKDRLWATVQELIDRMGRLATEMAAQDDFPSINEALAMCDAMKDVPSGERERVARVVAKHEVGVVPPRYRDILVRLGSQHRMGVISNVWAPSHVFRTAFMEAGIDDLFEVVVFSSDHRSVKPSARLFRYAIQQFNVSVDQMVFVGNDLRCDIGGARAAGLGCVWINTDGREYAIGDPKPDLEIRDLEELVRH